MKNNYVKLATALLALSFAPQAMAIIADDPKPSVVFEEDFSLLKAMDPWEGKRYPIYNNDYTMKDEFFHQPGWKGWYISYGQYDGVAHFEMDDDTFLQTPPINLSADNGKVTVTVELKMATWEGQTTKTDDFHIQLRDRTDGIDKAITGLYSKEGTATATTEWGTYSVTLNGGTADCSVRIWSGSYGGEIRNIKVMQVLPEMLVPVADKFTDFTGETFTANWRPVEGAEDYLLSVFSLDGENRDYFIQDKPVNETTYQISGLDPKKVYHYTVKARKGSLVSEESNIVRCFGVPRPEKPEISDSSEEGFKVSWNAPYNANTYQLETALVHTAPEAERYCLLNEDFLNTPGQDIDPDNAERTVNATYLDDYMNRANYTVKYPKFAADCISLDNTFASMGGYGEIDGPTMDLSADGGKVTVEMRVRALKPGSMGLYMLNSVKRENEFTSDKIVDRIELWNDEMLEPITEEWAYRTFTLKGGNEKSYIAIQAYGYSAEIQIDYLAIYQNLKQGETISVPYRSNVTKETSVRINTNGEGFNEDHDKFESSLMAAYLPDSEDEETVYSPWSETASVALPTSTSGVTGTILSSDLSAWADGDRIIINNPAGEPVSITTLSGMNVTTSNEIQFTTSPLEPGIYFISAPGMKTIKVAL